MIRDLEMGGDPGLSGWAQCQHRTLTEGNSECETMCDDGSRDGREVIPGRGTWAPLEAGKDEAGVLPEPPGNQPLILGQGDSFWPLTFRTGR